MITSYTMPNTYTAMVTDAPVLQDVIDQLKLNTTVEKLKKEVSVNLITNTQIIVVTVSDTDPNRAVEIGNTLADVFSMHVRELYAERYSSSKEGIAKQVEEMSKQIEDTNRTLSYTLLDSEKQQLEARLTEYTRLYSDMVMTYEQVKLAEAQTSANIVVTEPASPNMIPVSPKTTRNTILAVVVGMLAAMGIILLVDMLDDTIKNPDDIRNKFNLPILGVISKHTITEGNPIANIEPRSPVAESFRSLRTNINFSSVDKQLKKIIITSPNPQNGKTTISSNLAVVFAQGEKNVILVDADMRRPQIHQKFGLLNKFGLSDLFVQPGEELSNFIQKTDIDHLEILTTGSLPPNPC